MEVTLNEGEGNEAVADGVVSFTCNADGTLDGYDFVAPQVTGITSIECTSGTLK